MKGGLPTLPTQAAGTTQPDPLDFLALARRKADARGGQPWRSLEELADAPEFEAMIHREFPEKTVEGVGVDRRELFQFLGASFALAGLTACTRQPKESIVPYVRQPEELVPGRPLYFATAATLGGYATGLLIESHEGRPTKAEGNPLHPGSLGATDAFAQASLYALYDPDRSKTLLYLEEIRPWPAFLGSLRLALEAERAGKGAGLRILTETVTSPTMVAQIQAILRAFPDARWVQWEPVGRDNARAGAVLAFGEPVEPLYRFDRADVVLSLDADFLACGPGGVRFARDFASRRVVSGPETTPNLNRLWCVESAPGNTGARADHRIPMRAGD
ncbi:MAG TPA: TAT-variant-translocated molybdopterin oxidoreductase, partial [Thermoanaerobaculia bacterium]|nr:TAT-variant-translocated molybdopterin oxidoreductase [Thermoanaerobaculia bacterium]